MSRGVVKRQFRIVSWALSSAHGTTDGDAHPSGSSACGWKAPASMQESSTSSSRQVFILTGDQADSARLRACTFSRITSRNDRVVESGVSWSEPSSCVSPTTSTRHELPGTNCSRPRDLRRAARDQGDTCARPRDPRLPRPRSDHELARCGMHHLEVGRHAAEARMNTSESVCEACEVVAISRLGDVEILGRALDAARNERHATDHRESFWCSASRANSSRSWHPRVPSVRPPQTAAFPRAMRDAR